MRRGSVVAVVTGLLLAGPVAPAAVAQAAPAASDRDRVQEIVRDERVREIVRRVASISGDVRTAETTQSVQVDLSSDVLFAFDSATLSPEAATRVAEVATRIAADATGPVQVVGHTDSVGDDAYNDALSEQRAAAVAAALSTAAPADYEVSGRGESEPVAPNQVDGADNPAGRQLNRRVTITFATGG